jgi:hypothetical protein
MGDDGDEMVMRPFTDGKDFKRWFTPETLA